jgi:hypothetical protein
VAVAVVVAVGVAVAVDVDVAVGVGEGVDVGVGAGSTGTEHAAVSISAIVRRNSGGLIMALRDPAHTELRQESRVSDSIVSLDVSGLLGPVEVHERE